MQRTKLLAAVLALVMAGAAALVFAGSASAAEWHVYKGDVYAGHAYGLQVPAKAESFEVVLDGPANATASLAVYDPAGGKVGHFALSPSLTAASVAGPKEGRYVLYVYELAGGALKVRVNAPAAPALDLQKIPLKREDVSIAASDSPQKLDKVISSQLKTPAVFVTLLYQGSAEALDATVSSAKGVVMTVRGETGTAFAPGVYSSVTGERRMDAANLDGTAYTVEVHAASFEGTLVLTTLGLDLSAPAAPPKAPKTPDAKAPPAAPAPAPWTQASASPAFAFEQGKAFAFQAKAGELLLADPSVEKADKKERRGYSYVYDAVSIYAPDDSLLAYVVLDGETPNANVTLPVEGEYVAYVHAATEEFVLAKLAGATAAPQLRELALVTEIFEFEGSDFMGDGGAEFTLGHVPVALTLLPGEDGLEVLGYAHVENDEGTVASYSSLARVGGFDAFAWSYQEPANFRAGDHALYVGGLLPSSLTLEAVSYDRSALAHDAEHDEDHEDDRHHGGFLPGAPGVPATGLLSLPSFV